MSDNQCPDALAGKIDIIQPVSVEAPAVLLKLAEAANTLRQILTVLQTGAAGATAMPPAGGTGGGTGLPYIPVPQPITAEQGAGQAGPNFELLLRHYAMDVQHNALYTNGKGELALRAKSQTFVHAVTVRSGVTTLGYTLNFIIQNDAPTPYDNVAGGDVVIKDRDGAPAWIEYLEAYSTGYGTTKYVVNRIMEPGQGLWLVGQYPGVGTTSRVMVGVMAIPDWEIYRSIAEPPPAPPEVIELTPGQWVQPTVPPAEVKKAQLSTDYLYQALTPTARAVASNALDYAVTLTRTVGIEVPDKTVETVRRIVMDLAQRTLGNAISEARGQIPGIAGGTMQIQPRLPQPTQEAPTVIAAVSQRLSLDIPTTLLQAEPLLSRTAEIRQVAPIPSYRQPLISLIVQQVTRPVYSAYGLIA